MHNATFGRSRYLAGNILELTALAMLYDILPMGSRSRKDAWVNALVERLPQAKVVAWGQLNDKANYKIRKCQDLLIQAIDCIDDVNNPNVIQLAIMARLIELKVQHPNLLIESVVELQGLDDEEKFVCLQCWKLYQSKNLLCEALGLIEDIT